MKRGTFKLGMRNGRGGMSSVWRGEHCGLGAGLPGSGLPVAIKIMTASEARARRFREAFRNEVQAVARLNRPGVVLVLDHGDVDEAGAEGSDEQLATGSLYLVMEVAAAAEQAERARNAWELAIGQWDGLGDADAAARVRALAGG